LSSIKKKGLFLFDKQERTTFHRGATMKKQLPCIVPNCRSRFEE
jgi:hypothetical protein